jgi:hypothetical protein
MHFVNWPFFGPDATWQRPFLSLLTPPAAAAGAAVLAAGAAAAVAFAAGAGFAAGAAAGHLTNLPFASLHGAAKVGAATSMADKAAAAMNLRTMVSTPLLNIGR